MKKLKIAGICTVSGILGILIAGQFIYSERFIGNSTLNNIDVRQGERLLNLWTTGIA